MTAYADAVAKPREVEVALRAALGDDDVMLSLTREVVRTPERRSSTARPRPRRTSQPDPSPPTRICSSESRSSDSSSVRSRRGGRPPRLPLREADQPRPRRRGLDGRSEVTSGRRPRKQPIRRGARFVQGSGRTKLPPKVRLKDTALRISRECSAVSLLSATIQERVAWNPWNSATSPSPLAKEVETLYLDGPRTMHVSTRIGGRDTDDACRTVRPSTREAHTGGWSFGSDDLQKKGP